MTYTETTFGVPDLDAQKTSGLAVGSLVCSLILCCPLTTIVGPLLGVGALLQIGGNPALKGRRIALAAIALGIAFTLGQAWTCKWSWETFVRPYMTGPVAALTAGFAGDLAAFKSEFEGAGAQATDAEVAGFVDELRGRYGEFVSCRFDEPNTQPPEFGDPRVPFRYHLTFTDKSPVEAEAVFAFADETTGIVLKWVSITVFDPDLGDLTFPQPPQPATGNEPVAAPADDGSAPAADEGGSGDAAGRDDG